MGINTDRIIALHLRARLGAGRGGRHPRRRSPIRKIDPLMGMMPGLKAFVAAVLGGIGNIPGAMLGGLLIGLVETCVGRLRRLRPTATPSPSPS